MAEFEVLFIGASFEKSKQFIEIEQKQTFNEDAVKR